jgi:hypothetical protein
MAKKKPTSKTRPGRGADQFIVRLPTGMRDTLAGWAARHGRSMNAEILSAIDGHLEFLQGDLLNARGFQLISKRLDAGVAALEHLITGEDGLFRLLLHDLRDVGLEAFISHQRSQGISLTRREAIRTILRAYLEEHGYVRQPERRDREAGGEAREITGGDPKQDQFPE